MPRLKPNGLEWWINTVLMPGALINELTGNALALARAARPHNRAIAFAQLALLRHAAHS